MDAPSNRRCSVWVVDDSPLDAERALKALSPTFDVTVFSDGTGAIEHLTAHAPPDVLVLDWIMPGMSGLDVCQFIRAARAPWSGVAVLLLTAQHETEQIVEGLEAGANDFLSKPYFPEELRARVAARIREKDLLKRAEQAEASIRLLLEQSPDPTLALDEADHVTFVNAEGCAAFGQAEQQLLGKPLAELLTEFVRHPPHKASPATDVTIGERIFSPAVRYLPARGEASLIITLRDVTERRKSDRRRLDFYSILAHDLRGPLSAMLLRTEAMLRGRRGLLTTEALNDVRRIAAGAQSLVSLVNDFLDLARLEGTNYDLERKDVDISSVVAATVEELRPLLDASQVGLTFDPKTESKTVTGDRRRLVQVTSNLIGNAIKYTPPGGHIDIAVSSSRDYVETTVTDDGPGIPQEALPTLFDRFTRAPGGRAAGSGLGLMIVREIVQAHGGSVGVESEIGRGSRFWFRLPSGRVEAVSG